jgi:hypothetical protein
LLHCLGKVKAFLQFEKLENVSAHAAPKTMEDLLFRVNVERRRLLGVKRAEPEVVLPRLFEGNISRDKVNNVNAVSDPVYDIFGEHVIFSTPPR